MLKWTKEDGKYVADTPEGNVVTIFKDTWTPSRPWTAKFNGRKLGVAFASVQEGQRFFSNLVPGQKFLGQEYR